MATETAVRPLVRGWSTRARALGWALLAGWLLVSAFMFASAPRRASLDELSDAIAHGDVDTIQVGGGFSDDPGHTGYAELTIRWRGDFFVREVELREARPLSEEARDTDLEVQQQGVVARLKAEHPDLRVERLPDGYRSGFTFSMFGHEAMGWPAGGALAIALTTLGLLIAGPEPRRATRWAWFWLFGVAPPLGVLAYLTLGGPTALARERRPGSGRLTGGWAFLLSVLLSGMTAGMVGFG